MNFPRGLRGTGPRTTFFHDSFSLAIFNAKWYHSVIVQLHLPEGITASIPNV